ncbi:MAG: type VI secretion system tube protein Hcp [Alphaproteobacteria bacterium]|nr:type VI secretion system tube protein Hcp [Alphaproteobacteria bacterium]
MQSTNYILKIESIRGETRRDGKDDLIEVLSFEYGISAGHFEGRQTKRRNYTNIKFSKIVDRSTAAIQQMLVSNSNIRQATLTLSKAGGDQLVYYTLILKDAYIVSYKVHGEDFPDDYRALPREEFEISFRQIEVDYEVQNQKGLKGGAVSFRDDIGTNE